jgi:hypothetical protein
LAFIAPVISRYATMLILTTDVSFRFGLLAFNLFVKIQNQIGIISDRNLAKSSKKNADQ